MAERSLLHALEGGCQISMGVRSSFMYGSSSGNDESNGNILSLYALVMSGDGKDHVEWEERVGHVVSVQDAIQLGVRLATKLYEAGAARIIGEPSSDVSKRRPISYGSAETAGILTNFYATTDTPHTKPPAS